MNVSSNILVENWNLKKLRHDFVDERAMITTTLTSSCHWKILVPCTSGKKRPKKAIFNNNSELSQYRTEKQIMPLKATLNCLINDIWRYSVIGYFDWKIGVLQQTVVRVYYILKGTYLLQMMPKNYGSFIVYHDNPNYKLLQDYYKLRQKFITNYGRFFTNYDSGLLQITAALLQITAKCYCKLQPKIITNYGSYYFYKIQNCYKVRQVFRQITATFSVITNYGKYYYELR